MIRQMLCCLGLQCNSVFENLSWWDNIECLKKIEADSFYLMLSLEWLSLCSGLSPVSIEKWKRNCTQQQPQLLPKSGIRTPEPPDTILKKSQEFKMYDYISFEHFFLFRKDKLHVYSCVVPDEHLNEMLLLKKWVQ